MKITDISAMSSEAGMRWKQGVGIRWVGPGEWAMVCGTDEIVTVLLHGKRFMFSVDDAAALEKAVSLNSATHQRGDRYTGYEH